MKYLCLDCGMLFDEPRKCRETHGLDTPPYEYFYVCPNCEGSFIKAFKCDMCGDYITEAYIELVDGKRVCRNCYTEENIY